MRPVGHVCESIAARTPAAGGHEPFCHAYTNEKSGCSREVDFLEVQQNRVFAIEAKSSTCRKHPSTDAFYGKYPSRPHRRILLYAKDCRKHGAVEGLTFITAQFIKDGYPAGSRHGNMPSAGQFLRIPPSRAHYQHPAKETRFPRPCPDA